MNYTCQIITLNLFGILFILFKNCAPSPVNLVKYTDVLDKCIFVQVNEIETNEWKNRSGYLFLTPE